MLAHLQGAPVLACTRFLVSEARALVDYQDSDGHAGIHFATQNIIAPDMTELFSASWSVGHDGKQGGRNNDNHGNSCGTSMENNRQHMQLIANADPSNAANVAALAATQTALDRANKCAELLNNCSRGFCVICSQPAHFRSVVCINASGQIEAKKTRIKQALISH